MHTLVDIPMCSWQHVTDGMGKGIVIDTHLLLEDVVVQQVALVY